MNKGNYFLRAKLQLKGQLYEQSRGRRLKPISVYQLDGTGRISDSSSDEDDVDEDEDDDPYRRIADQIDDDTNTAEDEEQVIFWYIQIARR